MKQTLIFEKPLWIDYIFWLQVICHKLRLITWAVHLPSESTHSDESLPDGTQTHLSVQH